MISPLMISEKDDALLGVSNRSDAMGVLAVWSDRARDLVPHLTEQTTDVRGFQILVEAFRLWALYEPNHPQHAGRLSDFFLLVEQTFARIVRRHVREWPLPGARRVNARANGVGASSISLTDPSWHLMGDQKSGGIWGQYRGASRRAGLLHDDMTRLSDETAHAAMASPGLNPRAEQNFFALVAQAMDGQTVELPMHLNNSISRTITDTFREIPLRAHLYDKLISAHPLTSALAKRLLLTPASSGHRTFLQSAAAELTAYQSEIENVIRCEDLLSVIEAVFFQLCASKGQTLEAAAETLTIDLSALEQARVRFGQSGFYRGDTARARQQRLYEQLKTTSLSALARSVLDLHQQISEGRQRAAWVWEENGRLHSDVDLEMPDELELEVGIAWRNDYYLHPLRQIASRLSGVLHG